MRGRLRMDRRTKNLLQRVKANEIAVIAHQDLDEMAVKGLIDAKVKAVINTYKSISGRYPNYAPLELLKSGILLLDNVGETVWELEEGEFAEIKENKIYAGGKIIAEGEVMTEDKIHRLLALGKVNYQQELKKFIKNTLEYAAREMHVVMSSLQLPSLPIDFNGKHVLIVVRGKNYKEDLDAIRTYILEERPIIVAVDGGADALLERGFKPDIIIGDMDSVSDKALKCGAIRLVHAYPPEKNTCVNNWNAPGLERLKKLGLNGLLVPATGTSEDVAMLMAYEKGAALIVAVGTHSNMLDFLEKGRAGMASTMLVRIKVGERLVDARGVSQLYRRGIKVRYLAEIALAALLPFMVVMFVSPPAVQLLRLLFLQVRFSLGF